MISKPSTAEALAKVYIVDLYGEEELSKQLPLTVTDKGAAWLVGGSRLAPGQGEGKGRVEVEIDKRNGALLDIRLPYEVPASR